jgi:formiminotetrahydrofolate cyclodeaminase
VEKVSYGQKTIRGFLEELARGAPTLPAGGCAVALVGAIAAALERFVVQVTLNRISDSNAAGSLKEILASLGSLQRECVELMDLDVKEYTRVIISLRMPKKTREEKSRRDVALQEAKVAALGPPLSLAEHSLAILRFSERLVREGYPEALADSGVAAEMAHACFQGALWIAKVNLSRLTLPDLVEKRREFLNILQREEAALYKRIGNELARRTT